MSSAWAMSAVHGLCRGRMGYVRGAWAVSARAMEAHGLCPWLMAMSAAHGLCRRRMGYVRNSTPDKTLSLRLKAGLIARLQAAEGAS